MQTDEFDGANDPPRAVMLTLGELAARDGVAKPTVSIHVKKLVEAHGLTVERDGQGRVARVNAAEYDHLRGRYGDASKAQAPRAADPPPALAQSETYDEALRQKTWVDAETRRLALNELRGNLVRRDKIVEALRLCGEEIGRPLDQLAQEADALAEAYDRDGLHGLRVALKAVGRRARERMAVALEGVAAEAPHADEPLPFIEGRLL